MGMEDCCDRLKELRDTLGTKAKGCLPFRQKNRRRDPDENATPEQLAAHIGLIAPNGARKGKWDWFMLALVMYTSISVPYQLAFYAFTDWQNSQFGFVMDVMIDLIYIIDIFVSWRTTYYDREGMLVLDRRMARRRYLKTWFGIDVFASFPFEYLFQLILVNSPIDVPAALRLPSMVKLLRIYRLGKKINRLSSSKMFRIAEFTGMLLMAAHWYACLWFYLGGLALPAGGEMNGTIDSQPGASGTSWVYRLDMYDEGLEMQYASSLYWAVTTLMKSPWFHPNSPYEFIGSTVMIIFGCVLFAYFLGNVTAVITAANAAGGRYRGQIENLKSFCQAEGISAKMTEKLLNYLDALWTETNSGTDIQAMIKGMPYHLLPYVLIGHIYRPLMDACPFLYDCSAWGCVDFLSALKVQVCEKGDTLIHQGTLIGVMYILVRGEVKVDAYTDVVKEMAEQYVMGGRIGGTKPVVTRKTKSAKDMMRGRTDKFGTLLGFHDVSKPVQPREYSVNATTRVSLLMITRAQLNAMFNAFPQDKIHVIKAIESANVAHMNLVYGGRRSCLPMRMTAPMVRTSESDKSTGGTPPVSAARVTAPASLTDTEMTMPEKPKLPNLPSTIPENKPLNASPEGSRPGPQGSSSTSPAAPAASEAPSSTASHRGQWLNGLLSPMQGTGSGQTAEILALRAELAEQRKMIAVQSKMLEEILRHQKGLTA